MFHARLRSGLGLSDIVAATSKGNKGTSEATDRPTVGATQAFHLRLALTAAIAAIAAFASFGFRQRAFDGLTVTPFGDRHYCQCMFIA